MNQKTPLKDLTEIEAKLKDFMFSSVEWELGLGPQPWNLLHKRKCATRCGGAGSRWELSSGWVSGDPEPSGWSEILCV